MKNLRDLTYDELESVIVSLGEKKFRANQIFDWLTKGVSSYEEMHNIPKSLKDKLAEDYYVYGLKIVKKLESSIDGTKKYLFALYDGNMVETVVMYYKHGITVCISSQVGCAMGCKFCASTIGGLVRSLSAGEILEQVIFAQKDIGERISNIVMMGIGEPLANLDNVLRFLYNVNDEKGLNIGYRHISLSTCGIVPNIYELAKHKLPITLSISLHATSNESRSSIMPVNNSFCIEELIDACRHYQHECGRRISFEYAIIKNVNDSTQNAEQLIRLLKGIMCHVNVIPVNNVDENNFEKPDPHTVKVFCETLEKKGITATVRRELGSDINASCGQLRKNNM
ncbi:MAG: 23S rRNA (adenine(2503)-C(2))-methyltransferase RlmN [Clostridia bacterium]|nr:23S rRNA (adenine(2503)-C(2))-methyltransferase RlmN [Clostridia bacterium]